jgi:hypothetical protein
MMLFTQDLQTATKPDEEDLRASFTSFPPEVQAKIFAHLPWSTLINVIPFICPAAFSIVKNHVEWKKLDLSTKGAISVKDMTALFHAAHNHCLHLKALSHYDRKVLLGNDVGDGKEFFNLLMTWFRWPRLTSLEIKGDVVGFDKTLVPYALRRGQFPNLKTLDVNVAEKSFDRSGVFELRHLFNWRTAKLRKLSVRATRDCMVVASGRQFHQFANLRVLHLTIRSVKLFENDQRAFELDALPPGLVELKLDCDNFVLHPAQVLLTL